MNQVHKPIIIGIVIGLLGAVSFGFGLDQYKVYTNPKYHAEQMAKDIMKDVESINKDLTKFRELNIEAKVFNPSSPLFVAQIIKVAPRKAFTPKVTK
jgi:hypothetical protein